MKTLQILFTLSLLLLVYSCQNQEIVENEVNEVNGTFMNMKPTQTPILLAPELISSSLDEYNGTFSPDGKEFFFTTNTPSKGIICYTRLDEDGNWTKATVADFSGEYSEYDPLFSPNGDKLYFTSERPFEADSSGRTHIWYVEKENETWGEPKHLDVGIQGPYYSSLTNSGDIYFNVWDTGDLYKAVLSGDSVSVEKLSDTLNTPNGEGDPFISPEEDYLIFRGYNNSFGRGDLYISYKIGEDWTSPENLGEPINSEAHEMCPYVTADGKFFIFASSRISDEYPSQANDDLEKLRKKHQSSDNGQLNIYYISADFINEKRKKYE